MFRFTIRELVLMTVIVGLALGWGVDRNRLMKASYGWFCRANSMAVHLQGGGQKVAWTEFGCDITDSPMTGFVRVLRLRMEKNQVITEEVITEVAKEVEPQLGTSP